MFASAKTKVSRNDREAGDGAHAAIRDLFDMTAIAAAKPSSISTGFDYSALPADIAGEARAVARRILDNQQLHLEMAVEAGRALAGIKEKLGHGHWLPWLESECGINARTAQNYMATAEAFGPKYATVSYLPMGTVYKLAAPTADAVRAEVAERIEAGERPTPKDIENSLWKARLAAKAKAKRETPAERQSRIKREQQQAARDAAKSIREAEERVASRQSRLSIASGFADLMLSRLTPAERADLGAAFTSLDFPISQALWEELVPSRKSERAMLDERYLREVRHRYDRG